MQTQDAIKDTAQLIEEIEIGIKTLSEKTQNSYKTKFSARTFETALKRIASSNVVLSHHLSVNKLKSSLVTCGFSYKPYNAADSRRERVLVGTQLSLKRNSNLLPINTFSISHHCIQRILERKTQSAEVQDKRNYVYSELTYLPLFAASLIKIQEVVANIDIGKDQLSFTTAPSALEKLDLLIPTKSGALLGNIFKNEKDTLNIHVRTYLSDEMLNDHMFERKEHLSKTLAPFLGTYIELWPTITDCLVKKKQMTCDLIIHKLALFIIKDLERHLSAQTIPIENINKIKTLVRLISKDSNEKTGSSGDVFLLSIIKYAEENSMIDAFEILEKQITIEIHANKKQ